MREPSFHSVNKIEYSFLIDGIVGNMMRQHYHDGYEIYLHLDGERNVFFNNRKYILKRGDLFLIEPFALHMTTNSETAVCSRYVLNFNNNTFSGILSQKEITSLCSELSSFIIQLDDENTEIIKSHFEEIQRQWRRFSIDREKRGEKLAYMEIYRLVDKILQIKKQKSEIIKLNSLEVVTDKEIYTVLNYIEKNYAEEITLKNIIEISHMSQSSFYRAFKKITGDTFGNYLLKYRLTKAHQLVAETNIRLGEIAQRTGFSSTGTMTRAFRMRYGTTPSGIRKNN